MSDHDTTTTDTRDLVIQIIRRWLAEAAQWEAERAELVERAERIEKPLRAATMRAERAEADLHALRRDVQSGSTDKPDQSDSPSRSALKAKAAEAREALERERKISAGLRAERDDMRDRFESALRESFRSVEDRCADGFQQCHICPRQECCDNTNPLVQELKAERQAHAETSAALDRVNSALGIDAPLLVEAMVERAQYLRQIAKAARDRERARDLGADVDGVLDTGTQPHGAEGSAVDEGDAVKVRTTWGSGEIYICLRCGKTIPGNAPCPHCGAPRHLDPSRGGRSAGRVS